MHYAEVKHKRVAIARLRKDFEEKKKAERAKKRGRSLGVCF